MLELLELLGANYLTAFLVLWLVSVIATLYLAWEATHVEGAEKLDEQQETSPRGR